MRGTRGIEVGPRMRRRSSTPQERALRRIDGECARPRVWLYGRRCPSRRMRRPRDVPKAAGRRAVSLRPRVNATSDERHGDDRSGRECRSAAAFAFPTALLGLPRQALTGVPQRQHSISSNETAAHDRRPIPPCLGRNVPREQSALVRLQRRVPILASGSGAWCQRCAVIPSNRRSKSNPIRRPSPAARTTGCRPYVSSWTSIRMVAAPPPMAISSCILDASATCKSRGSLGAWYDRCLEQLRASRECGA